jgi:hypothetical protein
MYKWLQITPEVILTDIQRAARFYYLQKMAFGGKVSGHLCTASTSPPRMNLLRIEEELSAAHCAGPDLRRAPGLENLHPEVRPAPYPVLCRSAVLADRGLWCTVSV